MSRTICAKSNTAGYLSGYSAIKSACSRILKEARFSFDAGMSIYDNPDRKYFVVANTTPLAERYKELQRQDERLKFLDSALADNKGTYDKRQLKSFASEKKDIERNRRKHGDFRKDYETRLGKVNERLKQLDYDRQRAYYVGKYNQAIDEGTDWSKWDKRINKLDSQKSKLDLELRSLGHPYALIRDELSRDAAFRAYGGGFTPVEAREYRRLHPGARLIAGPAHGGETLEDRHRMFSTLLPENINELLVDLPRHVYSKPPAKLPWYELDRMARSGRGRYLRGRGVI